MEIFCRAVAQHSQFRGIERGPSASNSAGDRSRRGSPRFLLPNEDGVSPPLQMLRLGEVVQTSGAGESDRVKTRGKWSLGAPLVSIPRARAAGVIEQKPLLSRSKRAPRTPVRKKNCARRNKNASSCRSKQRQYGARGRRVSSAADLEERKSKRGRLKSSCAWQSGMSRPTTGVGRRPVAIIPRAMRCLVGARALSSIITTRFKYLLLMPLSRRT